MSNFLDEISWFMNLWKPDHRAEDAVFDLMVEDIQQKLKEQEKPPQKILNADNFFSEIERSKEEQYNKAGWSEDTLVKKVQSALEEAAAQGSNYIMIECDNCDIGEANLKPVKDYLNSLGFNTKNLDVDYISGVFNYSWYIKGFLQKCLN